MVLKHYSATPITTLRDDRQGQEMGRKPRGLWVSVGDNWKNWCEQEYFYGGSFDYEYAVLLKPKAKIRYIRTFEQLLAFTREYGENSWLPQTPVYNIDWARVVQDYQGIIISPYIARARMALATAWYYTWDIASGCIWDTSVIRLVQQAPRVH